MIDLQILAPSLCLIIFIAVHVPTTIEVDIQYPLSLVSFKSRIQGYLYTTKCVNILSVVKNTHALKCLLFILMEYQFLELFKFGIPRSGLMARTVGLQLMSACTKIDCL